MIDGVLFLLGLVVHMAPLIILVHLDEQEKERRRWDRMRADMDRILATLPYPSEKQTEPKRNIE